jgi:hypothetical protein
MRVLPRAIISRCELLRLLGLFFLYLHGYLASLGFGSQLTALSYGSQLAPLSFGSQFTSNKAPEKSAIRL